MNTAAERFPSLFAFCLNVYVLLIKWNVRNYVNFCEAGQLVIVAARQFTRIAVEVIQHILNFQAAAEFLKNNHVLPLVAIKRMIIIRDTVHILIAVLLHDGTCLTSAGLTGNIGNVEFTKAVLKLFIPQNLTYIFNFIQLLNVARVTVDDLKIRKTVFYQII